MGKYRFILFIHLLLTLVSLPCRQARAQCTSPINAFPYQEDFEAGSGGWTSGGTLDDWACGVPSKPVISNAGSGNRCWISGGLTASFYNLGEKSWVKSPCFDFTGLAHPYIQCMIFWETERQYDGASLQYSTDGGTTWTMLGSVNDPQHCLNQNWFNSPSVTNLSGLSTNREGWSGTTLPSSGSCLGGSGSGGWVTATHCLTSLSGNTSVTFRFIFGAGTTCNDYDGFAFDFFRIGEAPGIVPQFTATCSGPRTVNFSGTSNICAASWSWNFGDPASGSNTSTQQNVSHTFSHDTTFTISLQASTPCGNGATSVDQILFPYISFSSTPIHCPGDADGTVTASVINYGNPSYLWNVPPPNTSPALTGLSGGTYAITVTGAGICPATASYTLTEPAPMQTSMQLLAAGCGTASGSVKVIATGGTAPYAYLWSPGSDTTAVAAGLNPGLYSVLVTDSSGCTAMNALDVPEDCVNDILFPSAFTPNGDGRNDVFQAAYVRIATYEIRIFNRWGNLVFSSNNIDEPWTGLYGSHFAERGVYEYFATYSLDGMEIRDKRGRVTIYY